MKLGLREIVFMGAMLGLLAASYFLVFNKQDANKRAKLEDLQRKKVALAEVDREKLAVTNVDQRIADLQQAVVFFESKLPAAKEMDQVLAKISSLADDNGLRTNTIKFPKTTRMAGYSELTMELSVSGNFEGFYQFMLQLEALPRLTRVNRMVLNKITDKDGDMEASLSMSIFFDPDTTPSQATASAR